MVINLDYGISTMLVCLLLQAILLVLVIRYYLKRVHLLDTPSFWTSMLVINGVMLLLVIGNLLQIAIWALLFFMLGEFQEFNEAFYHSAVNFATLGYGDIVALGPVTRMLAVFEAVVGVIFEAMIIARLVGLYRGEKAAP